MPTPSQKLEMSELLELFPVTVPISYYQKQKDIIYISFRDGGRSETRYLRWLTVEKDFEDGSWIGIQLHHTGWLSSKLHLNPTKTSRFLASTLNSFLRIFRTKS